MSAPWYCPDVCGTIILNAQRIGNGVEARRRWFSRQLSGGLPRSIVR
jgi:hypothetical protein